MKNPLSAESPSSSVTSRLLDGLPTLRLKRLDPSTQAGLWITSLPWPRAPQRELGLGAQPTYCAPLGQWPGEPDETPRRLLLIADGGNSAPETIGVQSPNRRRSCAARRANGAFRA